MDAGGKDGAIRHVMSGVNPQGCEVFSFKQPSANELEHDFLWRATCVLHERGRIGIFNRSYYEEVLVVRVHPEAYEECFSATSTDHAPWFAVPADDKDDARLIVSQIVLDALGELTLAYPKTTPKRRHELEAIGKLLKKE